MRLNIKTIEYGAYNFPTRSFIAITIPIQMTTLKVPGNGITLSGT
jgi:hypothetical protein